MQVFNLAAACVDGADDGSGFRVDVVTDCEHADGDEVAVCGDLDVVVSDLGVWCVQ